MAQAAEKKPKDHREASMARLRPLRLGLLVCALAPPASSATHAASVASFHASRQLRQPDNDDRAAAPASEAPRHHLSLSLRGGGKRRGGKVKSIGKRIRRRLRHLRRASPDLLLGGIALALHLAVSESLALCGKRVPEAIVVLNVIVFAAWHLSGNGDASAPFSKAMDSAFIDSCQGVEQQIKRPHTLVLPSFSHIQYHHLAANMAALWTFSPEVMAHAGPRGFARLYSAGSIFSTLLPLYYRRHLTLHRGRTLAERVPSLGASGAISAVIMWVCLTCPMLETTITVPVVDNAGFSIPAPLAMWGLLWLCKDIQGASGVCERPGDEQTAVFTRIFGYPPLNICPPLHHGCRSSTSQ